MGESVEFKVIQAEKKKRHTKHNVFHFPVKNIEIYLFSNKPRSPGSHHGEYFKIILILGKELIISHFNTLLAEYRFSFLFLHKAV